MKKMATYILLAVLLAALAAALVFAFTRDSGEKEEPAAVKTQDELNEDLLLQAKLGSVSGVQRALDQGATINAQDERGGTALHWAASVNDTQMATFLLSSGAGVNFRNKAGWTPLHEAARHDALDRVNYLQVARILLDRGADVNARTNDGMTPLAMASFYQYPDMRAFLEQRGGTE